jgi:hypothetical protein
MNEPITKEPIWVTENNRPEQRIAFFAAICYCIAIIIDDFKMRLPFIFFEINIIVVGIGYLISVYKSKFKFEFITIGILWIFIGLIIGIDFNNKFLGIPIPIIGSHLGYFLVMMMIAITIIKNRAEYINRSSYIVCLIYTVLMAITHIISFLGVGTKLQYFYISDKFLSIGNIVIRLSRLSTIEFFSMLAVILSMAFLAPQVIVYFDEE